MSKYKTMRPENKWNQDGQNPPAAEKKPAEKKPRDRSKSKNTQDPQSSYIAEFTSEAYFQSDVFGTVDYGPPQEASGVSQVDGAPAEVLEEPQLPPQRHVRASSMRPAVRSKPMSSEAASAALRRAIQSSPARWLGTQHSPIELEVDMGTTRRLLFPSPRKDQSPGVLCETASNIVQPVLGLHSPMARRKQVLVSADKENCPPFPQFDEADNDIIKLFEQEMERPSRPTTPVQKSPPSNPFKTPTRPASNHRPITRSVSRSAKSVRMEMMPQRTPTRSSVARRRSPRNHAGVFESPFTATLNRLMSDANENEKHAVGNDSPSRHLDLGLDFSNLPDLGHSGSNGMHSDALNFHYPYHGNHDFFSTDVPMPSSPPRLFDVYEDPLAMGMTGMDNMDHMWSDFPIDENTLHSMGAGLHVDANGHASFGGGVDSSVKVKIEPSSAEGVSPETKST